MIAEAVSAAGNPKAPRVTGSVDEATPTASGDVGWGTRIRQILLTGVSYMIPFVAAAVCSSPWASSSPGTTSAIRLRVNRAHWPTA